MCLNGSRKLLINRNYLSNKVADLILVDLKLNLIHLDGQLIIVAQLVVIAAGLFHILTLVFHVSASQMVNLPLSYY